MFFFFQILRSDFFLDRDFSQCIPVYRRFRPGCNDFYKYLLEGSGGFPGWNLKLYLLTAYKTKHSYPLSTVSFPAWKKQFRPSFVFCWLFSMGETLVSSRLQASRSRIGVGWKRHQTCNFISIRFDGPKPPTAPNQQACHDRRALTKQNLIYIILHQDWDWLKLDANLLLWDSSFELYVRSEPMAKLLLDAGFILIHRKMSHFD